RMSAVSADGARAGAPQPVGLSVSRPVGQSACRSVGQSVSRSVGQLSRTTQEAAGASTEPARSGMPVSGSTVNQVTSPECWLATYRVPAAYVRARGQWPPQGTVVTRRSLSPSTASTESTSTPRVAVHTKRPSGDTAMPEGYASPSGAPGSTEVSPRGSRRPSKAFQRQTVTVGASSFST
ncbi:hypothetical protein STRIP9103_00719, partial [Streptomyces ipomoeae 91-03]